MEDRILIAKALVSCYAHIDDVCDALDASAEKYARSGFYAVYPIDQMRIYEKLIQCNERKRILYNMKFVIEKGFSLIRAENAVLLRHRYELKRGRNDMSRDLGFSLRTLYRKLERALEEFAAALERVDFDKKRLLVEFGNEALFSVALNRAIKEDDEATELREKWRCVKDAILKKQVAARVNAYNKAPKRGICDKRDCV